MRVMNEDKSCEVTQGKLTLTTFIELVFNSIVSHLISFFQESIILKIDLDNKYIINNFT